MALDEVRIFWRHVGREHRADGYAPDIRANPPDVVEAYLARRESGPAGPNRCLPLDDHTYVEIPPDRSWIIVYLADVGLQFSRGHKPAAWWLIDVVSVSRRASGAVCVADLFLDIEVMADLSYRVCDLDEFLLAARLGVLGAAEVLTALASLDTALRMLHARDFPGDRVHAALKQVGFPDVKTV